MRLWAATKAKALCIEWCMEMFFKVVQSDVNQCLEQIKTLRTPDLVSADAFEVEIQVNVALRAKLVSEVKVNICKLKVISCNCEKCYFFQRIVQFFLFITLLANLQ